MSSHFVDGGSTRLHLDTQFFAEDFDDDLPGFDGFDGDAGAADADAGEQDLLAATSGQTRRVRPETVNYAKRAKRVDVRKLKDNIWNSLEITVPPSNDENAMARSSSLGITPSVSYCFM
jgi:condensin complex subunit 2